MEAIFNTCIVREKHIIFSKVIWEYSWQLIIMVSKFGIYIYLERQVVSRPGGLRLRAGIRSTGGLGELRAPLAGSGRSSPSRNRNYAFLALKCDIRWQKFQYFDNFQCNADHKLQSQKYLGRQCLPWPLIKSAYDHSSHIEHATECDGNLSHWNIAKGQ